MPNTYTDYTIVENEFWVLICAEVAKLIAIGWIPLGGVAVVTTEDGYMFFQAMVLKAD